MSTEPSQPGQLLGRFLTRDRVAALAWLASCLVSLKLLLVSVERRDLSTEARYALMAFPVGFMCFELFWRKPKRHSPPGLLGDLEHAKERAGRQLARGAIALVAFPAAMLKYAEYRATNFPEASLEDRIALLAASGLLLVALVALPFVPAFRRWFFMRFGSFLPLTYCAAVGIVGVGFFSALAYLAVDGNAPGAGPALLDASGGAAQVKDPTAIFEFFSWHFFDAVPVLAIPDTLKWKAPFTYQDPGVGLLVLAFKVVVIAPSVGMVAAWWGERRSRAIAEAVRSEAGAPV